MIRAYRDGYNQTNLDVHFGPLHFEAHAVDEPWDGPGLGIRIRLGSFWANFQLYWGRIR